MVLAGAGGRTCQAGSQEGSGGARGEPVGEGLVDGLALQGDAAVRAPAQMPEGAPEDVVQPHGGVEPATPRARLQGVPEGVDEVASADEV